MATQAGISTAIDRIMLYKTVVNQKVYSDSIELTGLKLKFSKRDPISVKHI